MGDNCKVHVGNLSYDATEDDLRDVFEKFGAIEEVVVVMDRDTGRARGFGFVTFKDECDASEAIEALDNTEVGGRAIKVSKARPRSEGGRGRGYGGRGGQHSYGGGGRRSGGDRYGGGGGGYGGGRGGYGGGGDRYGGGQDGHERGSRRSGY